MEVSDIEKHLRQCYEEAGLDADKFMKIRQDAADFVDQYYKNHEVCPECGGGTSQTYLGYVPVIDDKESYKKFEDHNDARCGGCGWQGTVNDLKTKEL